jgi:hypothetical protein
MILGEWRGTTKRYRPFPNVEGKVERGLTDMSVSRGRLLSMYSTAESLRDLPTGTNQLFPLKRPRPRVHGLVR